MYQWNFFVFNACDVNDSYWIVYVCMWNWMFESGVIITGGKRPNATHASRDGAITPSRSVVAARESLSGVFQGSLEAYSPGACSQVSGRSDILKSRASSDHVIRLIRTLANFSCDLKPINHVLHLQWPRIQCGWLASRSSLLGRTTHKESQVAWATAIRHGPHRRWWKRDSVSDGGTDSWLQNDRPVVMGVAHQRFVCLEGYN